MNPEAIKLAYELFQKEGYNGSQEDFISLINSDSKALNLAHDLFTEEGYNQGLDNFSSLMGVGKKKEEELLSTTPEEGVDLSTQENQEEFLSGALYPIKSDDGVIPIEPMLAGLPPEDYETVSEVLEREAAEREIPEEVQLRREAEKKRQEIWDEAKRQAAENPIIDFKPEMKEVAELEARPIMEGIEMEGARAVAEPYLIEKRKEEFEEEYLSKVEREKEKTALQADEQFIQDIGEDFSRYFGMETDTAIRLLQNKYGKYGIRFEKDFKVDARGKSVAVGNTIKAIAYNNKEYTIPLIQYQAGGDTMPQDFKAFIEENARLPKEKPTKAEELGMEVFGNTGVDYKTYKDMQDRYSRNLDLIEFLSAAPFKESELQVMPKYMYLVKDMYVGGVLRRDYKDFIAKAKEDNKQIRNYLFSKDIVDTRYQLNLKLQEKVNKVGMISQEYDAKYKGMMQALEEETKNLFNLDIENLESFNPTNYREREAKNIILKYYEEAKEQRKLAIDSYALATSYWNEKTDKMLQGELVEGMVAWKNSLKVGLENGRAYNLLLPVMLGMTNINPDDTVDEVTLKVMEHLENADTGKFSIADREYFNARNNWEVLRALRNRPLDLIFAFAGQSIAQMLPIGSRLIPSAMAMGAGTGASIGFAITGTPQAALAGAIKGFKEGASLGYAATNVAIEYITAFMEAANEKYDVSDGRQLEKALQDEEVYAYANDVGIKRGLTIGVIDYLGARFAGAFMPASKLATPAVRTALKIGERIIIDPALEAFGETMAQKVSGQHLEFKEILAEALGAIGNNAPFAVMNQMFTNQKNTVSDITKELTNLNTFIEDNSLDSQVLDWTNRQEKMGRIDSNQAQQIRDNISIRSEAREILNVAEDNRQKPSNNPEAEKRLANLLKAKRKLTSTETTQEAFSEQISAINKEIKEIARTGDVVAVEQQADISMLEAAPTEVAPTEQVTAETTSDEKRANIETQRQDALNSIGQRQIQKLFKDLKDAVSESQIAQTIINIQKNIKEGAKITKEEQDFLNQKTQELEDKGFEIIDYTGEVYNQGMTLEILSFKPLEEGENLSQEEINALEKEIENRKKKRKRLKEKGLSEEQIDSQFDDTISIMTTVQPQVNKDGKLVQGAKVNALQIEVSKAEEVLERSKKNPKDTKKERIKKINDKFDAELAALEETTQAAPTEVAPIETDEKNIGEVNPTQTYSFRFEEGNVPPEFQGLTPTGIIEATQGLFKRKKFVTLMFKGQQLIDAGIATQAAPTAMAAMTEQGVVQDTEQVAEIEKVEAEERKLTPEDEADIQQQVEDMKALFDEGEVIDIQREQVTEEALPIDEETVSKVRDIATRASKAISRVLPQTNIVLHDTQDDFQANTGSTGGGFFDPNTNTIHINLTKATTTTVAHEVFHAILLNKIKTDTDVQNSVRNMVASVAKVVKKGTELSNKLDEFVALYESQGIGIMNEERLAELVGILSANYEQLTKPQKNIIIEFIRNIASKFGIELPEGFGKTDESVIDFLNTIARKTAIGEEITEVDIELLDVPSADGDVAVQPRVGREQIDANEVRSKYRSGSRISKGLIRRTVNKKSVYEETESLSRDYVKKKAPKLYIKNATLLAQEQLVKAVEDIKNIDSVEKADRVYDIFERQVADNLIFLTEQYEEYKDISSLWYDGANVLAQNLAKKYGLSTEQVAGMIASMSPQKDWYQNVRLAELAMMAYQENPVMTQEMVYLQTKISTEALEESIKKKKKTAAQIKQKREDIKEFQSQLQSFVGTKLKDIPVDFQAYPIRLWSEVNNIKDYDILRPDGEVMGKAVSKVTGKPKKIAWGSYAEIGKAVSIYNDGSASNITRTLGLQHKIRNFYNNIIDPMSKDGDVTIDTHAVAAALLKPLSSKAKQVGQAFGGSGASSSNQFGIKGTYFAYADAYNLAAQELGLLPRQVQSITWEAARGLFPDSYKSQDENIEAINNIWNRFENKEITYEEARNEVLEEAGGINRPSWAGEVKREPDAQRIDEPIKDKRGRGRGVTDDSVRDGRRGREQLVAFPPNPSIDDIVRIARSNGIKDDAIKIYLKDKGFSSTEINNALSVQVSSLQVMPKEFGNVEGGMNEGTKLFNQVRKKLSDFAKQEGRSSLIREKALDILKENPIFKKQDKAIQLELTLALDRSLGIRSNPRVRQEIAEIRKRLAEIKKDKNFTEKAKRQVRAFIRKNLPVSRHYNKSKINKLIKQVSMATPTNIEGIFENIKSIIEDVRQKMKVDVINEIAKIAKQKAKIQRTTSGKRRNKGVDAIGQSYFSALNQVLNAVKKNDIDALQKMQDNIDNSGVDMQDVIERASNNEPITPKERTLLDKQLALDGFSDIVNLELEEVQEILKEVKAVRAESIARLNNRRQYKRAEVDGLQKKAQRQIRDDYKSFYDEQGNPYDREQIEARKNAVRNELKANGVFPALKVFLNQLGTKIDYSPNEMASFFRNNMYHLKTILNIIDRGKEGFFTKYFWDNLSDADENTLRGVEDKTDVLDSIVNGVNKKNKKWSKWKYTLGEKVIKIDGIVNMKTGAKVSDAINKDQAMRIYALSLNDVQKNKLNKRGFTDEKIEKIKEFIGEDNVKIVDAVVSYLTNTYFDEINAVFEQLNDVSLGFVENYFPTSTLSDISVDADLISTGNFSKVFDAENSPFTKDRTDTEGIIEYSLPFTEILEEYIKVMERYKNYAPMVRQMNEVLKDSEIKTVLEQTGTEGLFRQNLNYAINPNARASNYTSREIHHSVYNIAAGLALGLKPAQIYRQAMSFIQAFDEYKFLPNRRTPALDLIGFILDMGIVMATFPLQVLDFMKVSATFKNRIRMGLRGDIAGLEGNLRNYKPLSSKKNFGGRLLRATERLRGLYTVLGDLTGVLGYKAVYNRMIRNGVPKATALRIANRYNETQQSRRAMEMTPLQQDPRSLMKMITMFASTSILQLNNVAQSLRSLLTDAGRFAKTGKRSDLPKLKDIRKLALNYALANMLWTASSYVFALTKGSDEDRDRALRAIKDSALGLTILERIPLLGFAITTLKNTLNGEPTFQSAGVNPYLIIFKNFEKEYKKVQETGEDLRMLIPIFETLVGMQFDSPIGIYNMLDGDISMEDMMDFLGVAPSYRPGYGSGKGLSYKTIMKEKLGEELFERLYGKKSSDNRGKSSREEVEGRLKERDKRTGRRQSRN